MNTHKATFYILYLNITKKPTFVNIFISLTMYMPFTVFKVFYSSVNYEN